jgi:hypothetical protein
MTQDELLKRLNLTPDRVSQAQELSKSLQDFDDNLKKSSPAAHESLVKGLAQSTNSALDTISRVVPELSRQELQTRLSDLLHHKKIFNGSSDTSFHVIAQFQK